MQTIHFLVCASCNENKKITNLVKKLLRGSLYVHKMWPVLRHCKYQQSFCKFILSEMFKNYLYKKKTFQELHLFALT